MIISVNSLAVAINEKRHIKPEEIKDNSIMKTDINNISIRLEIINGHYEVNIYDTNKCIFPLLLESKSCGYDYNYALNVMTIMENKIRRV